MVYGACLSAFSSHVSLAGCCSCIERAVQSRSGSSGRCRAAEIRQHASWVFLHGVREEEHAPVKRLF